MMIFERHGLELHYDLFGDGEPLLWVHGFMGAGGDWKHIFPEPPPGYRLVAPDLRGHGSSSHPSSSFSFRECSDDLLALLDHLGIDRAKAIGLSGGGIALLHVATRAPSRLSAMVVVSAPPYFPAQARAIQRSASPAMLSTREMDLMRERHKSGEPQIQQLFAQAQAMAESYGDVNFTPEVLSTIAAETLIVFGDRDPFYPVSLALELREAIPRSYLWIVPNGGHGPVFGEHASRFTDIALSFLSGKWRTAPATA